MKVVTPEEARELDYALWVRCLLATGHIGGMTGVEAHDVELAAALFSLARHLRGVRRNAPRQEG